MLYEPGIIPPKLVELWELTPALTRAVTRKESLTCALCGAKLRARRLADLLLQVYPVNPPARSLADWVNRPEVAALRIAEINTIDGLHETLSRHPNLRSSDYRSFASPGEDVGGIRHEDLCDLTYEDDWFDLILTSETLEHVPDLSAALRESRRVLKLGGRHIFTIPLLPGVERTFARSVVDFAGKVEHRATPIRHPGGDVGYPVFTEFGKDFPELLALIGFDTRIHFGPVRSDDIAQVYEAQRVR